MVTLTLTPFFFSHGASSLPHTAVSLAPVSESVGGSHISSVSGFEPDEPDDPDALHPDNVSPSAAIALMAPIRTFFFISSLRGIGLSCRAEDFGIRSGSARGVEPYRWLS